MSELYPCKGCIVMGNCSETCDKVIEKGIDLLRHMIVMGKCPDCGEEKSFLNFSCSNLDNIISVSQFNIMCYECFCCISIWMNLPRSINVTLHSFTKHISMPGAGRRVKNKDVERFTKTELNYNGYVSPNIIVTTYTDAIRGYIIPSIEKCSGRIPYELWEQGKWEEVSE